MTEPWIVYDGGDKPSSADRIRNWLEKPPPWRRTDPVQPLARPARELTETAAHRGRSYVPSGEAEITRVNMALLLRRPLLVTGRPGLGKTTLAYNIAWCLGLGVPLRWEINSQSTLRDGLYTYDAITHLRSSQVNDRTPLGDFFTLGPLGTALLSTALPRVLLVDEIDKASFDLPHDLLHVFEEGSFGIPELLRAASTHSVIPFDPCVAEERVAISGGRVQTKHHPVVVMTSNGERSFPEAFLRRCVQLKIEAPTPEALATIVRNQLSGAVSDEVLEATRGRLSDQATDVLLQALFLQETFQASLETASEGLRR